MKGSPRLGITAGLLLAGGAVLAAGPRGFEAQFSPVAVGEAPVAEALVAAPPPATEPAPASAPPPEPVIVYDAAEVEEGERALAALLGEPEETPPAGPAAEVAPAVVPAAAAVEPAADHVATPTGAAETPAPAAADPGAGEAPSVAAPAEAAAPTDEAAGSAVEPPVAVADTEPVVPRDTVADPVAEALPADAPAEVYIDPVAEAEAQRLREEKRAARRALQGPYVGAGGGSDNVSLIGVDDGNAPGLLAGFRYDRMLAVELALSRSEYAVPGSGFADCRLDASSSGLYLAARSEESLYLKARAGLISQAVESAGSCAPFSGSDAGFSFGAGFGVRLGEAAIEFEYTQVDKEIYRLGWSVLLNF